MWPDDNNSSYAPQVFPLDTSCCNHLYFLDRNCSGSGLRWHTYREARLQCVWSQFIKVTAARQPVTYKVTQKARDTATPTYLSELVQTRAPPRALRSSDARRSSHIHRTAPSRYFLLLLHPPGTLCLLTFYYAKTFLTFKRHLKPIYSNLT